MSTTSERQSYRDGFRDGYAAALQQHGNGVAPAGAEREVGVQVEQPAPSRPPRPTQQLQLPSQPTGSWGEKLGPDEVAELLASGAAITCFDCGGQVSGRAKIWVRPDGEVGSAFCGKCVHAYMARKAKSAS